MPSRFRVAKSGRIMSECDILTTLRAARAQVGTRRNKNAPRDIELFIQSPKIASGDIEQLYRFCKSGFNSRAKHSCSHRPVAGHANRRARASKTAHRAVAIAQ